MACTGLKMAALLAAFSHKGVSTHVAAQAAPGKSARATASVRRFSERNYRQRRRIPPPDAAKGAAGLRTAIARRGAATASTAVVLPPPAVLGEDPG